MIMFLWFALGIAVGTIPTMIVLFYLFKRRESEKPGIFESENISELIGRIQHVTSVNVDTLEKKILELKKTLREANDIYMKLNETISDAKNASISLTSKMRRIEEDHSSRGRNKAITISKEAKKAEEKKAEEEKTPSFNKEKKSSDSLKAKPLSKEEKIFELLKRGWTVKKIAESLSMGVGEVSLIVEIGSYIHKINGKEGDA